MTHQSDEFFERTIQRTSDPLSRHLLFLRFTHPLHQRILFLDLVRDIHKGSIHISMDSSNFDVY